MKTGWALLALFGLSLLLSRLSHPLDLRVTVWLQGLVPRSWDRGLSVLSLLGSLEVSLLWLALLLLLQPRRRVSAFLLFLLGSLLELILKLVWLHPAPPAAFLRTIVLLPLPSGRVSLGNSFPSGHSFRMSYLAGLLCRRGCRSVSRLLVSVFLVVFYLSRISLGEHWASDVLGGALLGWGLAFLATGGKAFSEGR